MRAELELKKRIEQIVELVYEQRSKHTIAHFNPLGSKEAMDVLLVEAIPNADDRTLLARLDTSIKLTESEIDRVVALVKKLEQWSMKQMNKEKVG